MRRKPVDLPYGNGPMVGSVPFLWRVPWSRHGCSALARRLKRTDPMGTQRVTDDLDRLLELLPDAVHERLQPEEARQQLLEVVLDLGRVPEARYPGRALALGSTPLSREDLAAVVARIGQFGGDNLSLIHISEPTRP